MAGNDVSKDVISTIALRNMVPHTGDSDSLTDLSLSDRDDKAVIKSPRSNIGRNDFSHKKNPFFQDDHSAAMG